MDTNFADYETSKMLKALGFDVPCYGRFHHYPPDEMEVRHQPMDWNNNDFSDTMSCPMWIQIKEWLFNKHNISIHIVYSDLFDKYSCGAWQGNVKYMGGDQLRDTPIKCEIDGIKNVIAVLYKQSITPTANNKYKSI